MSVNPFKLFEKVNGDFTIEKIATTITGYDKEKLKWHEDEGYLEYLTLNEILEQVLEEYRKHYSDNEVPFLRVEYESALWGVIFEVGNYKELDKQWIVHGITKGYA